MKAIPSFSTILAVLACWLCQSASLRSQPWPTEWKLVPVQDTDGNWKQAIRVSTLPGVVYHLQYSPSLAIPGTPDWTTIASRYGMGETWICPVLPGQPPSPGTPPPETITLPETSSVPVLQANLTLGRNALGQTTLSWISLDDRTMKRKVLPGVTLDSIWEDMDSIYLQPHGNHFFAISPRLAEPSAVDASSASFGPLDEAMVAGFEANLDAITAYLLQNVPSSPAYLPPVPNSADTGFYRIAADWETDSNGGGRYDWQQMLLDGTDPFGPGDGPEGADVGRGVTLADAPVPFDAAPPTPLARIQQQTITIRRFSETPEDDPPRIDVISEGGVSLSDHQYEMLVSASTFAAFKNVVDSLDLPDTGWGDGLSNFSNTRMLYPSAAPSVPPSEDAPAATVEEFHYSRTRFRLKLDLPAPASGYRIPMRTGIFSQTVAPHIRIATYRGGRDSNHIDIELQCAAGKTEGTPVEFPPDGLSDNERHTYIPASLSTRLPSFIADGYIQLGPIPEDGLCGVKNATFEMNFGNLFGDIITENYLDVPPVLEWQRRHLNADGTFGPWTGIVTREGLPGKYFKDAHAYLDAGQEGVYQIRASMLCPDGTRLEYPFVRMRDARSIRDSNDNANPLLQTGQPDYLGVAESVEAYNVRHQALIWLGSTQYDFEKHVPIRPGYLGPSTSQKPKCNYFLTHTSNQAGARVPYFKRPGNPIFYYAPTVKDSWFIDPEREVDLDGPGWKFQGQHGRLSPGRAVASVRHCGIIDYDGSWINAGTNTVNKYPHVILKNPLYTPFTLRARTED